jgi:hypothetical protein
MRWERDHGHAAISRRCMPDTSLVKKLQIKPGMHGVLLNAPDGYRQRLEPLPDGASLREEDGGPFDFVQAFVNDTGELERLLPKAIEAVKPDALLWICYPKGGARAGTNLNRDILSRYVGRQGLSSVRLVSIDDTWSAMRFRPSDRVGT